MFFRYQALDLNAEDKNALVARSQCHLLLGEPNKALEDAEAALALDKTFTKGKLVTNEREVRSIFSLLVTIVIN